MFMKDDQKERFTLIYDREFDGLLRFCLLRTSDREKALDITQEAFSRLWSLMASGEQVDHPKSFLFVVAKNLIVDWYRKKKAISLESLSEGDGREFDVSNEKDYLEIETNADAGRALLALEGLNRQYRETILFRYMEGLAPKEIGKILGFSANIISVRLTRGMEALRRLMGIKKGNH